MKSSRKQRGQNAKNTRRKARAVWIGSVLAVGAVAAGAYIWTQRHDQSSPNTLAGLSNSAPNPELKLPPEGTITSQPGFEAGITNDAASLITASAELLQQERWPQAVALLRRAIQLDTTDPDSHFNLGYAFSKLGRTTDAIAAYHKALEIDPEYAEAHINLGNIHRAQKNYFEATKHFSAALRIMPDHSTALNSMGHCLASQGKTDEAVSYFSQAVLKNPNFLEARSNLALGLLTLGKTDEAIHEFSEALRLDPNFRPAVEGLTLARRRQASEALKR